MIIGKNASCSKRNHQDYLNQNFKYSFKWKNNIYPLKDGVNFIFGYRGIFCYDRMQSIREWNIETNYETKTETQNNTLRLPTETATNTKST